MNTLPEVRGALPGVDQPHDETARRPDPDVGGPVAPDDPRARRVTARLRALWPVVRYPVLVYLASRILYLLIAVVDTFAQHKSLGTELRNWDGMWYLGITYHGFPAHVLHKESRLGFFPLYPILVWALAQVISGLHVVSGVLISLVTGGIATVLIARLATRWFGERAGRRGILFLCLFPGSIVFSMAYTEGLMLMLIAGTLLALEDRRWLTAGVLAGLSTAVGPVAFAIIPACAIVAGRELYRRGFTDREARRALLAPLLAPVGLIAFGAYLWVHTGSPLSSFYAQRDGWKEHSSPFALLFTFKKLLHEITGPHTWQHPGINLNLPAGLLGALILAYALWRLWQARHRVSIGAIVYTVGVAFLTVTSEQTPPNARMLLCAFPALLVVAERLEGRRLRWLIGTSTVLLVAMSYVSFVGTGLRP